MKQFLVPVLLLFSCIAFTQDDFFNRDKLKNMSFPFFSANEAHEGRLPEITPRRLVAAGCAHSHSCCASACSCCPDFSYLESYRQLHSTPATNTAGKTIQLDSLGRVVLTKNAGEGIVLKAFVLPYSPPLYQFSNAQGKVLAEYFSTLAGEAFAAAYSGATEFYEYNENGEAWVMTTDGTFCRIDRSGKQLSLTLSPDQLKAMDHERISDSLYAVRFKVHEHLPYHISHAGQKFETIVLISNKGKLVSYTEYSSVEVFTDKLFLVGKETFQLSNDIRRQEKSYSLVDRNFHVATHVPYELINPPADGLMRVKTVKGFGYIDMNGKEVIPCRYSGATVFENGRAYVIQDGEEFYINKSGKRIK